MSHEIQGALGSRADDQAGHHLLGPANRKMASYRRFFACVVLGLLSAVFLSGAEAIDNKSPAVAISSPVPGSTVKGTVAVSVSASDNFGVTKVNLLANGALVATDTVAPYSFSWDSRKVANGTVTISAVAYDAAGNNATASEAVTVANDIQRPTVAFSSPAAGSTVKGTVAVSVTASDNVGVTKVNLLANGALVATDTVAPYTFSWDSTKVANGTVTISAVAYDAAGNNATASEAVTVANDTQRPTVAFSSPAAGSTVKGTVAVSVSASDNVGVAKVNLLANGALVATDTVAPYAFSWDSTKVANGTVTISAVAYDAAGNNATASQAVTVSNDSLPPSVAIGSPAPGSTVKGMVAVSVSATDNVGVTKVNLMANGALVTSDTVAPYSFSWDSTKVANGSATLTATAYDAAGHLASATTNVSVQNIVSAATYYVSSSSGSDGNAGTLAAPWKTLAKVYNSRSLYKPGDSILLKRGDTWYETFNIVHHAGASGTPITYGAYGSGILPTVDAQHARNFAIYMDNVSHIVVRDLKTINATLDGFGIVAAIGNVADIVVQGVLSQQNARHGFSVEAKPGVTHVDALQYRNDESNLNGHAGFHAYNVSDGATGIHYYASKATYNGQLSPSHGFSAYFANNIHLHGVEAAFTNINPGTGLPNGYTSEGIGICFDNHTNNSTVEHSYSHHNSRTGLALAHSGSNNTASYNVVASNGIWGLVVNGNPDGSNNVQIFNNTIYGNKANGITAWQPINGLTIKNNILVNNVGYGIGFSSSGITGYTIANNVIFGNTSGATAALSGATGTIAADPRFVAPASGNFALQASSPAISAGINLGTLYQSGLAAGSVWPYAVLLLNQVIGWDIGAFVY